MIADVFDLPLTTQTCFLSISDYGVEQMRVLWFLRSGINQTRIRRCILRLEFLHGLKIRCVSDNFGKLLQLLELIQFRSSLFLFSSSSAHNKFSVWTSFKTYASIKRSTTTKSL